MHAFTKCNYVSGFYTSRDSIENFKFKIRLKEIYESIPILKIDFPSEDVENRIEGENVGYYEERDFIWQQKVNRINEDCDEDSKAGKDESEGKQSMQRIISYVQKDNYLIQEKCTINKNESKKLNLSKCFNSAEAKDENLVNEDCEIEENMFIVVDMADHFRETETNAKQEHVLFKIVWYPNDQRLRITPDFNDLQTNPYMLEINFNSKQLFHYSIEHISEGINEYKSTELEVVKRISQYENEVYLRKLYLEFPIPSKHTLKSLILFEILSAHQFEYNNIYVEYTVEIPHGYKCEDNLKGVTQISSTFGPQKTAHFSHLFELTIDYDLNADKESLYQSPQIFFEIISCDIWGRLRTEGYCYTRLTITQPGYKELTLRAVNPQYNNKRLWQMERYFIGGHHTLKEISSIGVPFNAQGDCLSKGRLNCANSGFLKVAINTILQNESFIDKVGIKKHIVDRLNADTLFKSVNTVLSAYKMAKEKFEDCIKTSENSANDS